MYIKPIFTQLTALMHFEIEIKIKIKIKIIFIEMQPWMVEMIQYSTQLVTNYEQAAARERFFHLVGKQGRRWRDRRSRARRGGAKRRSAEGVVYGEGRRRAP